MSNTTPWFADREKTGILTVGALVISLVTFPVVVLLLLDKNSDFFAIAIPAIVFLVSAIYLLIRESEAEYLKSIQRNPRRWLEREDPIGKAVATLEKRPLKDVRKFRYGLSSHIPGLVADLGESRVVPAYLEIVQYCLLREHPHLPPIECREQAMDEYRFLYKG
jgi:hypothetical protein